MKKRVLSVLVAAVLLLTMLTACGSKTDDALLGKWVCEMDFGSYLNEGLATDPEVAQYMMVDDFILEIELYLNEDGTYKMTADTSANKASYEAVKVELADGMEAYLTAAAAEYDMTLEDLLTASETTIEEMLDDSFGDDMYYEIIGEMDAEGKFEAADGKLFMSDGLNYDIDKNVYETYTLNGNTLTITGDSDGTTDGMYPMEFKK
ncbi:MAG: hypothetical protein IJN10_09020 [Firmicutes bacterium]|nr:hypothetical protein [Bacillota bacterium]